MPETVKYNKTAKVTAITVECLNDNCMRSYAHHQSPVIAILVVKTDYEIVLR